MLEPLVAATEITHVYPRGNKGLDGVDFQLDSGRCALVGVNGAGKSTLLSIISGQLQPTTGTVLISGQSPTGRHRRSTLKRVALMPQHLELPGRLTALEAVTLVGWMRGLRGTRARQRSQLALEAVGLADHRRTSCGALSGGMQRRVALAQALVAEPEMLVLDEPSTGLDPVQRRGMVELVQTLGVSLLFSSHVMEDVVDVAERVVVLHEGRVRFDGSVDALAAAAPVGTSESRRAEAGFLEVISRRDGDG